MTGRALRVGNHDAVGIGPEHATKCTDLGLCAAAPSGRVSLMGDEDSLRRDLCPADAVSRFTFCHQLFHQALDVVDVEAAAVVRAVGGERPEHLDDGSETAFARRIRALDDHPGRAHAQDQAVAAPIEGQGGLF